MDDVEDVVSDLHDQSGDEGKRKLWARGENVQQDETTLPPPWQSTSAVSRVGSNKHKASRSQ